MKIRHVPGVIAGALVLAACTQTVATKPAEPAAAPAQAKEAREIVGFVSPAATRQGGEVKDTVYSERQDDAVMKQKTFADGNVTIVGVVGQGKGSKWAGVGISPTLAAAGTTVDASAYRSISFKLASPTTARLRLRIVGPEEAIVNAGCYPIFEQNVTAALTEYTIPLASFASENWCGPKARSVGVTLAQLNAVEVIDITMAGKETRFTVGTVRLNP